MKKELLIEGMTCEHCQKRVEKALNDLEEVENARVILEENKAVVDFNKEVSEEKLKEVIEDAGYNLTEVK